MLATLMELHTGNRSDQQATHDLGLRCTLGPFHVCPCLPQEHSNPSTHQSANTFSNTTLCPHNTMPPQRYAPTALCNHNTMPPQHYALTTLYPHNTMAKISPYNIMSLQR